MPHTAYSDTATDTRFDRFMVQLLEPQEETALVDVAYNRIKRNERYEAWQRASNHLALVTAIHELLVQQRISGVVVLDTKRALHHAGPATHQAQQELAFCPAPDMVALNWKKKVFRNSYSYRYGTDEFRAEIERVIEDDEKFLAAHPVKIRRDKKSMEA